MDDATLLPGRLRWESVELEAEVRGILDAIEAPPVEAEVIIKFQKILYWARLFNEDGRGQIVLTCRCILESTGNENAFRQPFVNAVLSSVGEFADQGLELVEAFDQIDLAGILEQMRRWSSSICPTSRAPSPASSETSSAGSYHHRGLNR